MLKITQYASLSALIALTGRAAVFGASIGDALSIISTCSLLALTLYLESKQQLPIHEEIRKEVSEIKSSVNALKLMKSLR
jgi:aspartyl/asparaginyl beta-hydroxylase (cupin superfamily)